MNKGKLIVVGGLLFAVALVTIAASSSDLVSSLRSHKDSVNKILSLADSRDTQGALMLLDSLHAAVIKTRASLRGWSFEGQTNMLTDPFTLPKGVYRVHFTTEGIAGIVEVFTISGRDQHIYLFNLLAIEGLPKSASTLYKSTGERILVQVSNVTAPYEVVFEQLK